MIDNTLETAPAAPLEPSISGEDSVTPSSPSDFPVPITEEQLIEQTLNGTGGKTPQDLYAQLFYLYMPKMKNELKHMSNKALRRLLAALIESPLNDKPYKMNEVGERMVFQMATNLLEAKFGMMMAVMAEQQRKQEEQNLLVEAVASAPAEGEAAAPSVEESHQQVQQG